MAPLVVAFPPPFARYPTFRWLRKACYWLGAGYSSEENGLWEHGRNRPPQDLAATHGTPYGGHYALKFRPWPIPVAPIFRPDAYIRRRVTTEKLGIGRRGERRKRGAPKWGNANKRRTFKGVIPSCWRSVGFRLVRWFSVGFRSGLLSLSTRRPFSAPPHSAPPTNPSRCETADRQELRPQIHIAEVPPFYSARFHHEPPTRKCINAPLRFRTPGNRSVGHGWGLRWNRRGGSIHTAATRAALKCAMMGSHRRPTVYKTGDLTAELWASL